MRIMTSAQSREVDELSGKAYGLSGEILMEAAGLQAARECQQNFYPELTRGLTAIVCGAGHNGADGLVMARHLHSMGYRDLVVFVVAGGKKRSSLFKLQLKRAELHGIRIVLWKPNDKKMEQLNSAVLIVDALFGIGFRKKLEGEFSKIVEMMNAKRVPIISLDVPSGLNCDTGVAEGIAVHAHTTFTFGLPKPGFFTGDGPQLVGKLRVLPIGYPFECLRGVATTHFLYNDKLARRYLPVRKERTNKGDYGRLVVCAGADDQWGAGILAAQSAYRMGAGYVVWAGRNLPVQHLETTPEVLTADIDSDIIWDAKKVTAYAVGPGLGVNDSTFRLIRKLKDRNVEKVVLDADAINTCVKHKLFPLPKSWVCTPHPGELSRMIGWDVRTIEADRYSAAQKGAEMTGAHVLLKGYRSILAYEGRLMVVQAGNSALAKAGSGDVLTGMIGALLAQGLETIQATATAAFVHGRMADEWVRSGFDKRALNPSDLKDSIAGVLAKISQGTIF